MRARVFLREGAEYRLAVELSVEDADDAWRRLEAFPHPAGRHLMPDDIVYVGDLYLELDSDGGWHPLTPGDLSRDLYQQILNAQDEH